MSLALLAPLYLAGLLAVAAPVLLHLRQRPSGEPHAFSTLRFLLASDRDDRLRRRLLRWLLLLLRVAVVAAIAAAFARPWLTSAAAPRAAAEVLVVDVSASMRGPATWAEAQAAAAGHAGGDVAVVAMGRRVRVVRGFGGEAAAAAAVAALEPTWEAGDADAALRRAGELLAAVDAETKTVRVVSDFARPAWSAVGWNRPLPPGVAVAPVRVAEASPPNLAVASVEGPRDFRDPAEELTIRVTVRRLPGEDPAAADTAEEPVRVRLKRDGGGAPLEREAVVPLGGQAVLDFALTPGSDEDVAGSAEVVDAGDGLPADDAAFFRVPAAAAVRIGRLRHPDTDDAFLAAALAPGYGGGGGGKDGIEDAPAPHVLLPLDAAAPAAWPEGLDLLLVDHAMELDPDAVAAVETHLAAGRPLMLVLGERSADDDAWEASTLGVTAGRLEQNRGTAAAVRAGGEGGPGFGSVDLDHPVLAPLGRPRSGDLLAVEVKRWRAVLGPGLRPLIRMPGGEAVLGVGGVSGARLAVSGVGLDRAASSWPVESTFLPVLHEAVAWLTGGAPPEPADVGDPVLRTAPGGPDAYDRPGVFGDRVVSLAAAESDPRRYTADTFTRLAGPAPEAGDGPAVTAANRPGADLSPWLLALAAAAAAAELGIGNRLSR